MKNKINKIYKALGCLKNEGRETIEMINIYYKLNVKKEKLSDGEIDKAIIQLSDCKKMAILAPLLAVPMSYITIPIAFKIAEKLNKDLTPSSFKNNESEQELEIK